MVNNLIVPEWNHLNTMVCQQFRPTFITNLCLWFIVVPTIEFYRQFCFAAIEIKNKLLDRMLSAKAETAELLVPQTTP